MNVSVIIVFLSFLLLGVILTMTISGYWYNEKHTTLATRAENIAEYVRMNLRIARIGEDGRNDFEWINSDYSEYMNEFLHIYAGDVDSDIIIVDKNSNIVMSVSDNKRVSPGMNIKNEIVEKAISQNTTFEKSNLGGAYPDERYVSTKAIYGRNGLDILGAVIITTNTNRSQPCGNPNSF